MKCIVYEGTIIYGNKRIGEIRIYVDNRFWKILESLVGKRIKFIILPKDFLEGVIIILPNGTCKISSFKNEISQKENSTKRLT